MKSCARIYKLARAARLALPLLFVCAIGFSLTSCGKGTAEFGSSADPSSDGGKAVAGASETEAAKGDRVTVEEVAAIAKVADRDLVDGWINGRDPRVFKSYYKTLTPMQKAQFAMAYHDMIEKSDQNLAQSYKTYIPYKKRVAFARNYWENSEFGAKFKSEIEKMQVAWIHESLLDGSELWWRAAEKRFGNAISSPAQMAHDVEQNMVSKYMEDEGTESTFSQQMTDKTKIR